MRVAFRLSSAEPRSSATLGGWTNGRGNRIALTLVPSDLIEQAVRDDEWTDSDRRHCSRILRQAFEESFQVKEIQRTVNGLIAYDAPFASFESVRFQEAAKKPTLQAHEDLSKKLLLAKREDDVTGLGLSQ